MKKEERHQIKRDDLATMLERVLLFAEDHLRPILVVAAAVLVAVASVALFRGWQERRATQAAGLVGELIETYNRPIVRSLEDLQDAPSGRESFTSTEERDEAVLAQADAILAEHRSGGAVPKALYYRGLALAGLKRYDEAVESLEELVRHHSSDFLAPMALYHLARVREAQGDPAAALPHFQALADAPRGVLPPEEGLLGVARCQEALGEKEAARGTYQRLLEEFPGSDYARDARARLDELS